MRKLLSLLMIFTGLLMSTQTALAEQIDTSSLDDAYELIDRLREISNSNEVSETPHYVQPDRRYRPPRRRPNPPRYPDDPPRRRPQPPRSPYPDPNPRLECRAYDNGHEEHWGGHSSCRSCLREHDNCTERCSEEFYRCDVRGTDRTGYTRTFSAEGNTRWSAEDRALDRCYWAGYDRCYVTSCREDSDVVSRRRCY